MLSSFAVDKENQLSHARRLGGGAGSKGVGGKHRKGLGSAGSENAPPAPKGKASFDPKSNPRGGIGMPLGNRHAQGAENAPAPLGKSASSLIVNSKPKQRRTLGDISNRGQASGGAAGGSSVKLPGAKLASSGLGGFVAPSKGLSIKVNGANVGASDAKTPSSRGTRTVVTEKPLGKLANRVDIAPVEMAFGRLGDEEELLVQNREERRMAAAMVTPFRSAKPTKTATRGNRSARAGSRAGPSLKPASASASKLNVRSGLGAAGGRTKGNVGRPVRGGGGEALSRDIFEGSSTDRIIYDDFEEMLGLHAGGAEHVSKLMASVDDKDLDWLAVDDLGDLDSSPVSPLDDNFLTQDLA